MPEPLRINTREAILLLTLIGAGIGLVLGLIPLIYGRIKGKAKLGVIGLICSIVAGAIWSILPLFVMITFVFLILRETRPGDSRPVDDETAAPDDADIPN